MSTTVNEKTIGELVVERPSRARLFDKLGIDYCCGGRITLQAACKKGGLDYEQVAAQMTAEAAGEQPQGERNWATASITDLCDNVEHTHHAYLKEELPRLEFLTAKVANRHGANHPELLELRKLFVEFKAEFDDHMEKEERILFPMCRELDTVEKIDPAKTGGVEHPIRMMMAEHDSHGEAIARVRQLTNDFTPPEDACNSYRALYDALRHLEDDTHLHIHKENNIMFPKAARAEALLSR